MLVDSIQYNGQYGQFRYNAPGSNVPGNAYSLRHGAFMALIGVLAIALYVSGAHAGCSVCGGSENWDPMVFLNGDTSTSSSTSTATQASTATQDAQAKAAAAPDTSFRGQTLVPLSGIDGGDVILDVTNADQYSKSHVKGAVHIPEKSFLNDDGTIKSAEGLAEVLGEAGITRDDSVLVYSNSLSSGEAALVFWALTYLGQNKVKLLDGGLVDYKAASLPLEIEENTLPAAKYIPTPNSNLLASYDYVNSDVAQIVDARTLQEFGKGRIPAASIIEYSKVLDGDKLLGASDLKDEFSKLSKDQPVVVYSDGGEKASLVWYALKTLGYDARIYTWEDWLSHQSGSSATATDTGASGSKTRYTKLG